MEDDFHLVEDEGLKEISHDEHVKFTVGSGQAAQVSSGAVGLSGLLRAACEKNADVRRGWKSLVVPADPALTSEIVAVLVKFMEHMAEHDDPVAQEHFTTELLKSIAGDDKRLMSIAIAAHIFDVPSLLLAVQHHVLGHLKAADSPADARKRLGVASDFTPAELERIERECQQMGAEESGSLSDLNLSIVLNRKEDLMERLSQTPPPARRKLWRESGLGGSFNTAGLFDDEEDEGLGLEPTPPEDSVLFELPRRRSRVFLPDSASRICMASSCQKELSTMDRKHCRACGRLFCSACCNNSVQLPDNPNAAHALPITSFTTGLVTKLMDMVTPGKVRKICTRCYGEFREREEHYIVSRGLALLALPLPYYLRTAQICRSWRKSSIFVLQWVREIQYLLPTQALPTETHRQFLLSNMGYFAGHSQWLLQVAKAIDWDNPAEAQTFAGLLGQPKKTCCWDRLCTRVCNERMSAIEATQLLDVPYLPVRKYATDALSSISGLELSAFLPLLVRQLRHEPNPFMRADSESCHPLWSLLLARALVRQELLSDLYWLLQVAHEQEPHCAYDAFKEHLVVEASRAQPAWMRDILRGKQLEAILSEADVASEEGHAALREKLARLCSREQPLQSPVCPEYSITAFDVDRVVVKNSATKPIVLPCLCILTSELEKEGAEVVVQHVMYKLDDVRQDYIALNLVRLIDLQLQDPSSNLKIDVPLVTYRVLPVGVAKGFVQFVDDAATLFDLERSGNGILHYLMDHNDNRLPDSFVRSTAGYSVITYLLGVGDRHGDNVMVTRDGRFFHIDFGYVLGNDPKPLMPPIRLSPETVTAMKGDSSAEFQQFLEMSESIYVELRRYPHLFLNMLRLLVPADRLSGLEYELTKRFLIGFQDKEAGSTFRTILEQSKDSGSYLWHRWIHDIGRKDYLSSIWSLQDTINGWHDYVRFK